MNLRRLLPDPYILALLAMVALASIAPAYGRPAVVLDAATEAAVALLFFLHGAKLSSEAVIGAIRHWRLHLTTLTASFVLFPVAGLALRPLLEPLVGADLYRGVLFLCMLPSTVQSSIAFTSIAQGNVAAAVCGASASNMLGIVLTPLLVGLFVASGSAAGPSGHAIVSIVVQLLLPFVAGQIMRRWIGRWVDHHKPMLKYVDQGSILLMVYAAFGAAVHEGLWQHLGLGALAGLLTVDAVLLAVLLLATTWGSRALGFSREDEIAIVFCGSKKSLATGIPMAKVLLAGQGAGSIVLPLMLFHQLQLMVCAVLARRYARREPERPAPRPETVL
jgi:sodium/bile acid cotransporter 7